MAPTNTMLSKCLTKHAQNFLSTVIQKANYVSWKAEKWKKMKYIIKNIQHRLVKYKSVGLTLTEMTGAAPKCEFWIIALTTSFLVWSFVFLQIANRKYNSQSIKIWYVLLFELFTVTAIALFGLRLASNPVCKDQCHCNPVWRPLLCETLNSGDIFCLNPLLSFPKISVSRQEFTSVKLRKFEFCRKLIDR